MKIPEECEKCIHRYLCLELGFAKDKEGCLARSQAHLNTHSQTKTEKRK